MKRRDFLRTASGVTGAAAAVGAASAGAAADGSQDSGAPNNTTTTGTPTGTGTGTGTGNNTTTGGAAPAGPTKEVVVGPGGDYVYTPGTETPLYIAPGTTVNFVWDSDNHNVVVDSQPEGADWGGHEPIENSGFEYSHTFDTLGEYTYFCQPHKNLGMEATIVVNESGQNPNAGAKEQDPEHMGVPFQAHFVGIATILAIISSLLYTFYSLKYGESAHTAAPNKD